MLSACASAYAAATNEEFFKSMRETVDKPVDPTKFLAVLMLAAAVILLLVVLNRKRQKQVLPKQVNHPGKLAKEVAAAVHLKPVEMRQLRLLAEGQDVSGPVTLLLCPSVLAKAVREKSTRIDKKIVAQIARKLVEGSPAGTAKMPAAGDTPR